MLPKDFQPIIEIGGRRFYSSIDKTGAQWRLHIFYTPIPPAAKISSPPATTYFDSLYDSESETYKVGTEKQKEILSRFMNK